MLTWRFQGALRASAFSCKTTFKVCCLLLDLDHSLLLNRWALSSWLGDLLELILLLLNLLLVWGRCVVHIALVESVPNISVLVWIILLLRRHHLSRWHLPITLFCNFRLAKIDNFLLSGWTLIISKVISFCHEKSPPASDLAIIVSLAFILIVSHSLTFDGQLRSFKIRSIGNIVL